MYRHPFDAISFFFGLLFTAGALSALLVDDPWPFDRGGVWSIMLIVGGLGLLIAALRPGGDRQPATTAIVAAPVTPVVGSTDRSLTAAHREIDEYLGDAVPGPTAEHTLTAEVVVDESDATEIGSEDVVTAEVVIEDAGTAGIGPDVAVTGEVAGEPVEGADFAGEESPDPPTTSPDKENGTVT